MFKIKNRKFLLNEKTEPLDPAIEIIALNSLLASVLKDENYESATVIRSRLEQIMEEYNL